MARIFNAISNLLAAGAIICLAGIGAIWLAGCSGAKYPVAAPTAAQVDDLKQCAVDLADIARRSREMAQDGGAE